MCFILRLIGLNAAGDEERLVREKLQDYVSQLEEKLQHTAVTETKEIDITEMEEKYKITDMPLFIKVLHITIVAKLFLYCSDPLF